MAGNFQIKTLPLFYCRQFFLSALGRDSQTGAFRRALTPGAKTDNETARDYAFHVDHP
jgi:hypothetical protein